MNFQLRPLDYVVLFQNMSIAEEGDYSAEFTRAEVLNFLNSEKWRPLPKKLLEEALYCCNMNYENRKFWHPEKLDFKFYLGKIIPKDLRFDLNWNIITERKVRYGQTKKKAL